MRLPRFHPYVRLLAVAYGVLILFWLSLEDNLVWPVVALAAGLVLLLMSLSVMANLGGGYVALRYLLPGAVLFGALAGLGTGITAPLLMIFKNAHHAHLYPDYPPALILATLQRTPFWTLAGAAVGLSAGLTWLALRRPSA